MIWPSTTKPLVLVLALLSLAHANYDASVVTITSLGSFSLQRQCAQICIGNQYLLAYQLGCTSPALNGCFCRSDLGSSASTILSSCLAILTCNDPADRSSAMGVYNEYCSSVASENAGIALVSATTTDGSTGSGSGSGVATAVIITTVVATGATSSGSGTQTPTPTPSQSPIKAQTSTTSTTTIHSFTTIYPPGTSPKPTASSGGGGGGLSISDTIALGVGLGVGIPTLIVGIIGVVQGRRGTRFWRG